MKASVIVCTYSLDLLPDTLECINSLINQDYPDKEIILVMDRNEELYAALKQSIPEYIQIVINEKPGLSEARNAGIKHTTGEIIVFIDDDAAAAPGYLTNLMKNYNDPSAIGAGGKIIPKTKPSYPEELYWIGGFTYKGFPEKRCAVRNVIGCNMSFRKEVFDKVGLFDTNYGRVGRKLITAEETEFSLRVLTGYPGLRILYDPSAIVYHKVHDFRQSLRYAMKRSFFEGRSKALINKHHSDATPLETEGNYLKHLMHISIPSRFRNIVSGDHRINNIQELIWISTVIVCVGAGYTVQKVHKL